MKDIAKRIVIFLIRKRLGLKKGQRFQFENQRSNTNYYCFEDTMLVKIHKNGAMEISHVSLNWLLDDKCKICKIS